LALIEIGWIVCRNHERPVVDGRVRYPGLKRREPSQEVRVEDCLDCRHLIATSIDRLPEWMCSTVGGTYLDLP